MYYSRIDVRAALLNFARSTDGIGIRETAFYNSKVKALQRYFENNGSKRPVNIDNTDIDYLVSTGASAFYFSYWRYASLDFDNPIGRDLVWIVRPKQGGIVASKKVTKHVVDVLKGLGIEPWIKYDGDRGFDIIIPLETIPYEAWMGDLSILDEIQRQLTDFIASQIDERTSPSNRMSESSLEITTDAGICLLSELRVRRGLLLAPMSLNPKTDLISVPISADEIENFTVLNATKKHARPASWDIPHGPNYVLMRFAPTHVTPQPQATEA